MSQKIIFLIVIISSCSFSQNQISLIPETIKIDDYFVLQPDTIRVKDINNDFQKEILRKNRIPQCKIDSIKTYNFDNTQSLYLAYWSCGERYDYFDIYLDSQNGFSKIGTFNAYWSHFAEIKNGVPQIVQPYYEGHKTNPIYFIQTYAYNGTKYEVIQNDHLKLGEYRDLGLNAYDEGDYDKALICFQNILRPVWHSGRINAIDYNNLALVFIKTSEYSKAEEILQKALILQKNEDVTYYNLGLLYEKQNYLKKALEYYRASNDYKHTKSKNDKINELQLLIKNEENK